jgi:hypothetical protein
MAAELQKLKLVLGAASIDPIVIDHMENTLMIASVTDFVNYVEHSKYETELGPFVLETLPPVGDNPHALAKSRIQLTRLRTAWEAAFIQHEKKKKRRLEGAVEDTEEPLDEMTRSDLLNAFITLHAITPTMHLMPADSLLGRVYREYERGNMTVLPIKKAMSLYLASLPREQQLLEIGNGVQLQVGKVEAPPIKRLARYYFGLRILGNAKSIAGCHKVESKIEGGKQVVFSPMGVNLDYADHWLRKTSSFSLPESVILDWALTRDEETRAKEVELVRGGWPQGEALTKALQMTEIAWTVGPSGKPVTQADPPPEQHETARRPKPSSGPKQVSGSGRKILTCSQLPGGQHICKKFNDARRCVKNERQCPDNKKHVCDVRKPDGAACGSKSHNRSSGSCPYLAQQDHS